MAGLTAAARVLPHRLTAAGLQVRYGLPAEGLVPDGAPAAVTAERRKPPGGRDGLQGAPGGIA